MIHGDMMDGEVTAVGTVVIVAGDAEEDGSAQKNLLMLLPMIHGDTMDGEATEVGTEVVVDGSEVVDG
jgi:hypothetical protein